MRFNSWFIQSLILVALAIQGCASTSGPSGQDIVTESDEPDVVKRSRIRLELASGYLEQGKLTIALDEVKQSLNIHPSNPDAHNLRGLIYMQMGDVGLAEDSYRRALSISPAHAGTLHNYGWFLCGQSRDKEAHEQFARALRAAGYANAGKTHMAQAMCYQRNGQSSAALTSYLRAHELEPGNPIVSYNLALLYFQQGDLNRAQFHIRRINASELANAQTVWLGLRIERRMGNMLASKQLSDRLMGQYGNSEEAQKNAKGLYD